MESIGFSCGQAIKFGWKTMIQNIWFFISIFFVSAIIVSLPLFGLGYATNYPFSNENLQNISFGLLTILFIILKLGLLLGFTRICIKFARCETPTWGDLFSRFLAVPSFLAATLIFIVMIFIGVFLFFFPAVIWAIKFGLYPLFIADQQVGPIKALELSSTHTRGAKWDLFAFFNVAYTIFFIGLIALVIGLIFALPVILLAYGRIYKYLREPRVV